MPTSRTDLSDLTWEVIVNMELQVEQQKVKEEKQVEIETLRKKVIDILGIPKVSSVEEIRLVWKVRLTESDIENIKSKEVLKEILKLHNETDI